MLAFGKSLSTAEPLSLSASWSAANRHVPGRWVTGGLLAGWLIIACLISPGPALAEETWPQWRGPNRNAQVNDPNWPDTLDEQTLVESWHVELGRGYSGPIVSPKAVFVASTVDGQEILQALDRQTGRELWKTSWKGSMRVPFFAAQNGSWIRSTPAYDGENLFVAGMRDVLVCLDAETGQQRWRVDFRKRYDTPLPSFGFVCSPLVIEDSLYVQAGGGFVKLDKKTGESVWRVLVDDGGMSGSAFSSPILATLRGQQQVLVQTRKQLAGVHPETGEILWKREIPATRGMNILTPTVQDQGIFTSAYGGRSLLVSVNQQENQQLATELAWTNKTQGYMSSPVVVGDYLYLHLKNQRVTCIDLRNGEIKWTSQPYGKYWSMVTNGEKILALDQRGELFLLRATPEKFDLHDQRVVSKDSTWAHLAICGQEIFIRELRGLRVFRWRKTADKPDPTSAASRQKSCPKSRPGELLRGQG